MPVSGFTWRAASRADRPLLADAAWSSADPAVEGELRERALDRLLDDRFEDRRLLLFFAASGGLVAAAAHKLNTRFVDAGHVRIEGTELELVAIVDRYRDDTLEDGSPLVVAVLEVVFDDIRSRHRGSVVFMLAHDDNRDGRKLCDRLGAEVVGRHREYQVHRMELDQAPTAD